MRAWDRLRVACDVLCGAVEIVCELDYPSTLEMARAVGPGHWIVERVPTVYVPGWYSAGLGRGGSGQVDLVAVRLAPRERVVVLRWR